MKFAPRSLGWKKIPTDLAVVLKPHLSDPHQDAAERVEFADAISELFNTVAVPDNLALEGGNLVFSALQALGVGCDSVRVGFDSICVVVHARLCSCGCRPGRDDVKFNCAGREVMLTLQSGCVVKTEAVLVAAGRRRNTGSLNLVAAGLAPGDRGDLQVDEHYRTAVPHIYAAGDVIGFPGLALTDAKCLRWAVFQCTDSGSAVSGRDVAPDQ